MVNCFYCGNEIPREQVPIPVKGGMICMRCKELRVRFPGGPTGTWVVPETGSRGPIVTWSPTDLVERLVDIGELESFEAGMRNPPVVKQDYPCGSVVAVWCPCLMTFKEAVRYAQRRQPVVEGDSESEVD